jgi:hypothetical protein
VVPSGNLVAEQPGPAVSPAAPPHTAGRILEWQSTPYLYGLVHSWLRRTDATPMPKELVRQEMEKPSQDSGITLADEGRRCRAA